MEVESGTDDFLLFLCSGRSIIIPQAWPRWETILRESSASIVSFLLDSLPDLSHCKKI